MSIAAAARKGRTGALRARRSSRLFPLFVALLGSSGCGRTDPGFAGPYQEEAATAGAPNAMASAGRAGGGRAGVQPGSDSSFGGGTTAGGASSGTSGASSGAGGELRLRGAPLVFAPTAGELGLNVVLAAGDPAVLRARVRAEGEAWRPPAAPEVRASDVAEWRLAGLEAGVNYEYQIVDPRTAATPITLYSGRAVTQRPPGERFGFALLSDPHIGADLSYSNQGDATVLQGVSRELGASAPDFAINLGDILDFHQFGFNDPPPDSSITRLAYLNYRDAWGSALGNLGHFGTIGNWDGENGSFTSEEISRSRSQRLLYLPSPGPTTYREGGAAGHDYYAFSWGDALFVVLNVMSYTPSALLLSTNSGQPEDWTLGNEQLAWLEHTLQGATANWRFLFIHHAVGGAAGDEADSIYGRGGGRAAHVGEQATVHQLMLDYGVQVFFYGHDHVFTDMVVDGIHYTSTGNAGAIWTFPGSQTGYTQYWEQSGWAHVDVAPNEVSVSFRALGGEQLFGYTLQR